MRSPLEAFPAEVDRVGLGEPLVHCRHGQRARVTAGSAAPVVR
ncbi:hypothetical protein QFZ63_000977 [Streptomyces sp. B3I7]|nr:hypothetical protein [Streptomyces sp. B3I7]MDQ0809263.1 hypothetical protein [Streptomyces sp. B3I7]